MYLSRLILNPRSRAVQRNLARLHDLHKTILSAFPVNLDKEADRVLFRLDQLRTGELHLLVQSQIVPDWLHLQKDGYLLDCDQENPAVKAITLPVQPRQQLAFRLRANPTKRLSAGKGNTGKRIGLYALDDQVKWLERKAADHGFAILSVMPTQQQRVEGRIPIKTNEPLVNNEENTDARKVHDAKFFSVQFDGILQVTDPVAFLTAVQAGIGSGKAFGFGLLSLAPVRE